MFSFSGVHLERAATHTHAQRHTRHWAPRHTREHNNNNNNNNRSNNSSNKYNAMSGGVVCLSPPPPPSLLPPQTSCFSASPPEDDEVTPPVEDPACGGGFLPAPRPRAGPVLALRLFVSESFQQNRTGPCVVIADHRVYVEVAVCVCVCVYVCSECPFKPCGPSVPVLILSSPPVCRSRPRGRSRGPWSSAHAWCPRCQTPRAPPTGPSSRTAAPPTPPSPSPSCGEGLREGVDRQGEGVREVVDEVGMEKVEVRQELGSEVEE